MGPYFAAKTKSQYKNQINQNYLQICLSYLSIARINFQLKQFMHPAVAAYCKPISYMVELIRQVYNITSTGGGDDRLRCIG